MFMYCTVCVSNQKKNLLSNMSKMTQKDLKETIAIRNNRYWRQWFCLQSFICLWKLIRNLKAVIGLSFIIWSSNGTSLAWKLWTHFTAPLIHFNLERRNIGVKGFSHLASHAITHFYMNRVIFKVDIQRNHS